MLYNNDISRLYLDFMIATNYLVYIGNIYNAGWGKRCWKIYIVR